MKALEGSLEIAIPPTTAFIIRIDGASFHTFLKGVDKPFDARVTLAMTKTTVDLVRRFSCSTGFAQSDEISLVFPNPDHITCKDNATPLNPAKKKAKQLEGHVFNGRVQKLCSTAAGYASARFNSYISEPLQWAGADPDLIKRMVSNEAYFDGRVVPFTDKNDLANCILWRSNYDGFRNAVLQISATRYGHRCIHKQSCENLVQMLNNDGIEIFTDYPAESLLGIFVKREQFHLQGAVNLKTGLDVETPVLRSRIAARSVNLSELLPTDRNEFLLAKFWTVASITASLDSTGTVRSNVK